METLERTVTPSLSTNRRLDIQILRGYAVLIVVIYHAGLKLLPGGFIGVDVFFVISGYLITGIIRRDLRNGSFSLSGFYARRAKRLFPAAYVTFFIATLLAPHLLTSAELHDYGKQLLGALTFSANYILKNQAGYFDGAADLKPLLHTWSLSVEEQFYFLIPTLLILVPRRAHRGLFYGLFILSLGGCLFAKANPETIFYTLPYRAWELALGAMGAEMSDRSEKIRGSSSLWVILAWAVLIVLPMAPFAVTETKALSMAACLATVWLLIAHPIIQLSLLNRALSRLGDVSYSLYLVHWPIFAYFSNTLIEPAPYVAMIRVGLILISLLLAYLLYRWVEIPFLKSTACDGRTLITSVSAAAVIIGLIRLNPLDPITVSQWKEWREPSVGLNLSCSRMGPLDAAHCRNGSAPNYLIWGDSMAMHLVNGIANSRDPTVSLIQATRYACIPVSDIADYRYPAEKNYLWEKACIQFNDEVLDEIRKNHSFDTVILSGNFVHLVTPERPLVYRSQDNEIHDAVTDPNLVFEALKKTIHTIRESGHKVVLVIPPPRDLTDVSRCQERRMRQLWTYGGDPECRITLNPKLPEQRAMRAFLERVSVDLAVEVISFDEALCDLGKCKTMNEGIPLYRDESHFGNRGGNTLIKQMGLIREIDRLAH